jgi:hypothetical protein
MKNDKKQLISDSIIQSLMPNEIHLPTPLPVVDLPTYKVKEVDENR